MRYLKYMLVFVVCLSFFKGQAQVDDTLPPWVMIPFNFKIIGLHTTDNGSDWARVLFRSSNNPDQLIRGLGQMFYDPTDFPGGEGWVRDSMFLTGVMTSPQPPQTADNWPGGQPPFPMQLDAYLSEGDGMPLVPPRPVTVRVIRVFFEELNE